MDTSTSAGPIPVGSNRQDAVRHRAEEIYIRNGRIPGRDRENWAQAEREIAQEMLSRVNKRTAVIVKVDGVQYVGEYSPASSGGYQPGEIVQGGAVGVRFEGDSMFLLRPNGKELRTTIVKKV